MPTPKKPDLWPFLKEIFFNKTSLAGYIGRHKLAAFLSFTNTCLIVMLLFISEQAVRSKGSEHELRLKLEAAEKKALEPSSYNECRADLSYWQENYRKLSQSYKKCPDEDPRPPPPKREREPALPARDLTTDDSLRRKLDAIRD